MFKVLKEKIKNLLIKSQRKLIFEEAANGYIGDYKIQDDKVICYVDNKLLKKYMEKNHYKLELCGSYTMEEKLKKICDDCGILKPIYYIIDGMEFASYVYIFSVRDAHIIFKNCTFKNAIKIYFANDIIFENNKYEYPYPSKDYAFLTSNGPTYNIKFINDNFINSNKKHPVKFGMEIKANNVEISDTNISGDDNSLVQIECDNLVIGNSNINCDEIVISSKKINFYDASTNANKGFIMNKDTMYIDFDQENRKEKELENSRINLINSLRNLRDKCNQDIENKLENKENKLKNKKIKKYFK